MNDNNEGNEYTVLAPPADIWLCYGVLSSSDDHDVVLRTSATEVTWSHVRENATDVHYVLADRLNAADTEIAPNYSTSAKDNLEFLLCVFCVLLGTEHYIQHTVLAARE